MPAKCKKLLTARHYVCAALRRCEERPGEGRRFLRGLVLVISSERQGIIAGIRRAQRRRQMVAKGYPETRLGITALRRLEAHSEPAVSCPSRRERADRRGQARPEDGVQP